MEITKNRIERFIVEKMKEITGKGPRNIIIQHDESTMYIKVKGYLTKLEKEILEIFPNLEQHYLQPRLHIFNKYVNLYNEEIKELFGCEVIDASIEFDFMQDEAAIRLKMNQM